MIDVVLGANTTSKWHTTASISLYLELAAFKPSLVISYPLLSGWPYSLAFTAVS